jgi:competence protein ComEA
VGLALAKTIVADRERGGPFGGLAGLDRVTGIGPGLLAAIGPHVKFSGAAGPPAGAAGPSGSLAPLSPDLQASRLTGGPEACLPRCSAAPPSRPLNLNAASVSELDGLPGIGPARAAAILHERQARGPFASVEALSRVPGLGPSTIARLRDLVVVH